MRLVLLQFAFAGIVAALIFWPAMVVLKILVDTVVAALFLRFLWFIWTDLRREFLGNKRDK